MGADPAGGLSPPTAASATFAVLVSDALVCAGPIASLRTTRSSKSRALLAVVIVGLIAVSVATLLTN